MQLNIYVPKDRAAILESLEEASKQSGRPKNEIVLEALEGYLAQGSAELGIYDLGPVLVPASRDEIYLDRAAER